MRFGEVDGSLNMRGMERTLPATWPVDPALLWRAAKLLAVGGVIFIAAGIALAGYQGDAYVYWWASHLPPDLYAGRWNLDPISYIYPPIFAQILAPLGLLPYPLFYALWVGLETAALVWLAGPLLAFALILPYEPVQHEILTGNVNLMLAAAVVLAVRHPAWWAAPLLSKVTPGVGLLYHALRREWRLLGAAVAVTSALAAVSIAVAPQPWAEWVSWLLANSSGKNPDELLPFGVRLAGAILIVVWGAWRGQRWTMVLAAGLALPNFVPMNLAYFVALLPFLANRVRAHGIGSGLRRERVGRP